MHRKWVEFLITKRVLLTITLVRAITFVVVPVHMGVKGYETTDTGWFCSYC